MDRRGAAPRPGHVRDMANLLLAKRGESPIKQSVKNGLITSSIIDNQSSRHVSHEDMIINGQNVKI